MTVDRAALFPGLRVSIAADVAIMAVGVTVLAWAPLPHLCTGDESQRQREASKRLFDSACLLPSQFSQSKLQVDYGEYD